MFKKLILLALFALWTGVCFILTGGVMKAAIAAFDWVF